MNKYTISQKLKLSHEIAVEITGVDSFGVSHYSIITAVTKSGQPPVYQAGWIPVSVLDNIHAVVLS